MITRSPEFPAGAFTVVLPVAVLVALRALRACLRDAEAARVTRVTLCVAEIVAGAEQASVAEAEVALAGLGAEHMPGGQAAEADLETEDIPLGQAAVPLMGQADTDLAAVALLFMEQQPPVLGYGSEARPGVAIEAAANSIAAATRRGVNAR